MKFQDDIHADDVLKSVPSPTVCEQLPSAVVEAVPENVLKFSAAPAVHHSAPHATVESPLQHETSVTKTEVKPIMTSSHAEPEVVLRIFRTFIKFLMIKF